MVKHKITAPGLPANIVQRERLFHLLDNNNEKPVKWISGPGGSGKTTLVSSYLQARKLSSLWYQIDQGDDDPSTFFYYMGLAFSHCAFPEHEPLPLLAAEYLAGIKAFTRHYFDQLFTQLPNPYVIVLDDYQEISLRSAFHELFMEGISLLPDGITIIVLSRNEPPPVLTIHDSAKRIESLGWSELRFSFEEAKQFAGMQSEYSLENEALTHLYLKTDGWIAGLLLIMESMKGSPLDYQLLESLPLDKVFGYFAVKIFDGCDEELQTFLLKTAFAPGVTAQMAEQLTSSGSSEQILSRLCRNRFFTEKSSPVDPVYLYHPLFREFLLVRAEKTFSVDEVRELRRKAAGLLAEAGRTEDAARLLMDATDWDGMTELILNSARCFVSEGRSETIRVWLESIPEEIVERVPGLLYWEGVCLLLHSPLQSRNFFRKAFDLYSLGNDRVGMSLSWSGGSIVSLYDGEFTPLDQWLSLLAEMNLDDFVFPLPQLEEQVVMSIFNAMAFRQPHHPDIAKWRERAVPLLRGSADIDFRLQSAVHLLVNDLWNGNFTRATFVLEQTQGIVRSRKISPMTDITIKNAQVLHAFFTGAWASGVSIAVEALRLADETGVHVWDSQLLGNGASCALSKGDFSKADELLQGMEARLEWCQKRFDIGYYHGLRGWEKNLRNEFQAASQHLELNLEAFHAIGFLATEVVALNSMAENLRELGKEKQAGVYLSQAADIACGMRSLYLQFICLLTSVELALDASDELQAVSLLRKAMALGSAGGYVNGWFWRPAALLRLCIKALENGIEVDYVRDLIRRHSLIPKTPPLHISTWPWSLKIQTLGTFELIRGDETIALTGKAKKPLELLKALIAFGGKNVSQERLNDALWPDADGDLAQRSFETTLHRLRKLLGNEKVLQLQAGRLSIDPRYCWIDIWAFERQCDEIEEALKGKGRQKDKERLALYFEKTVALYKGKFLPEEENQAWTLSLREHLHGRIFQLQEQWEES